MTQMTTYLPNSYLSAIYITCMRHTLVLSYLNFNLGGKDHARQIQKKSLLALVLKQKISLNTYQNKNATTKSMLVTK